MNFDILWLVFSVIICRPKRERVVINNVDATVISHEWYPQGTLTFSLIEINCHDKKFSSMPFSWSTHTLLRSSKCFLIIIASWSILNRERLLLGIKMRKLLLWIKISKFTKLIKESLV